ncbi:class I SAM-dependent methyltransferase [Pseudonocardia nigra]|uniref:class I SAM-dependent methyltransferase n=1 Tax=Pseudonocardia nigra TaxID=1921578 RepID=UPI0027E2390C|nr:class I SAM-dependent methyltransferase [Pseudonocardia nigra]
MEDGSGAFTRATGRDLEGGTDQPRYRRYQYDLIAPHCGRSVLEIGAGLGEFAAQFRGLDRLVVTDVDPDVVQVLHKRFADRPDVRAHRFEIGGAAPAVDPVDTVVAINVLEHIEDDAGALREMAALVRPGGRLVMWVPGYPQLYGEFDRRVGHVRRYTPTTLDDAFRRADLEVERTGPANLLGGVAWWIAVRRGGAGSPNPRLVRLYDRFVVPVTRAVERVVRVPFGQSVLGVARRPPEPREGPR